MEGIDQQSLDQAANELLKTEKGMFLLELDRVKPEIMICIESAHVDEKLKDDFKKVLENLRSRTFEEMKREEYRKDEFNTYDMARWAITQLLDLVKNEGKEADDLFILVRDLIWKTIDSIKGWDRIKKRQS